ncbi:MULTISPECIES: hypothetical protein [unclassified Streptomyces]|uniref:hypothetical protein n=1 Tax=unclassified Streptomyces TaxID=2593676 RepID=UPI0033B3BA21
MGGSQRFRAWAVNETVIAPRPRRTTELRRRLLLLSVRSHWHLFWSTPAGRTPAARVELRQRAADGRRARGAT